MNLRTPMLRKQPDHLRSMHEDAPEIVAIIKVSLEGRASLIGTGFFITTGGHLITAKHVIKDNIDEVTGSDIGGIGALFLDDKNFGLYLPLGTSHWHPQSDIAISDLKLEYHPDGKRFMTTPLRLSVIDVPVGGSLSTRFFCHADRAEADKNLELPPGPRVVRTAMLEHAFVSGGPDVPATTAGLMTNHFGSQDRRGTLRQHHRPKRDSGMLNWPVFESNLAIPGSASGGPVFNSEGLVVGVNTSGMTHTDVTYHTYIDAALQCGIRLLRADGNGESATFHLWRLASVEGLNVEGFVAENYEGSGASLSAPA